MRILAIETSCDETAAAIVEDDNFQPKIVSNIVASQMAVHAESGGVIPNIAARLHVETLPHVLQEVTEQKTLSYEAVAATVGPGLIGSLLTGVAAAKTIALAQGVPFFAINHLEGHIYSAWLAKELPELPALIIIVSGGHTELIYMQRHLHYQHLGHTRDDAAGEAFDKVARLLDLPYPGGPNLAELAKHGDHSAYQLPMSLLDADSLEFSFSGIKASVATLVGKLPKPLAQHAKADIAASFQHTVAEIIAIKTLRAFRKYPAKSVCLVGGVSANTHIRAHLEETVHQAAPTTKFIVPPLQYCTDNAAMIGAAAVFHHLFGKSDDWSEVEANPSMELG